MFISVECIICLVGVVILLIFSSYAIGRIFSLGESIHDFYKIYNYDELERNYNRLKESIKIINKKGHTK